MPDPRSDVSPEDTSRTVARAAWGVLLIWMGAALLLRWGWGVSLVGAGAIVLAAQALRRYLRLKLDGFGLVAGALLVLCGAWTLLEVDLELVPLLCIGAGIALLVSTWSARRSPRAPGGRGGAHAAAHPRA
jgi:hypothetical protein